MKLRIVFLPLNILVIFDRVKAEFIRMKYQQMAYINRLKDDTNGTLEDLNLVIEILFMWKWRTDNVAFSAITFDCSNG